MPNLNNTQKTVLVKDGDNYIFKVISEDTSESLDDKAAIDYIDNLIEVEKKFLGIDGDNDEDADLVGSDKRIKQIDKAIDELLAEKVKEVNRRNEEAEKRKEAKERLRELRKLKAEIKEDENK